MDKVRAIHADAHHKYLVGLKDQGTFGRQRRAEVQRQTVEHKDLLKAGKRGRWDECQEEGLDTCHGW